MREGGSYRAARKRAAKRAGVDLATANNARQKAAARELLGRWAAAGGAPSVIHKPIEDGVLATLNGKSSVIGNTVVDPAAAVAVKAARDLTMEDVDKALENLLSQWQAGGNAGPLPLSRQFCARARQLLWVEGVEFAEVKG